MRPPGSDLLAFEAMQQARSRAETLARIAAIKGGRVERLAGRERVGEVEGVEPAGDAHLLVGRLLHSDAPVAAPAQRAEPDAAVLLAGIPGVDGKPRVDVVAGVSLAAFQHLHALVDGLVVDLRFGGPAAGQIGQLISFTGRQVPGGRLRALHHQRSAVLFRWWRCVPECRSPGRRGNAAPPECRRGCL